MRSGDATTSLIDALSVTENANRRVAHAVEEMRDHAAVSVEHHELIRVRGDDALERTPDGVEGFEGLGTGNDVPAFLAEDLHEHRVVVDRARAEDPAFPFAEEHLAEIRLSSTGVDSNRRERGGGLVGAS